MIQPTLNFRINFIQDMYIPGRQHTERQHTERQIYRQAGR